MKRILIYIAALTAALLVPQRGTDIGKLQPVGVVQLYREGASVVIVTDTGDSGTGKTVQEAFRNLEETTAGVIFLDTADYLLLSKSAVEEAPSLETYLKQSIRVCFAEAEISPAEAAEYLPMHRPNIRLRERESLANAETLAQENGRLVLRQ